MKTQYEPGECKEIAGFDGLYEVAPDGTVWSLHNGEPEPKRTFSGELGPRVALYRFGERVYQPYVHVLVRKHFGEDTTRLSPALADELLDDYRDSSEALKWLQNTFEAAS